MSEQGLEPAVPDAAGPAAVLAERHPISLAVSDDLRRRRLTVFFRLILALLHLVWLTLWIYFAVVVAFVDWLVTLVRGRSPETLHEFLSAFVRFNVHVNAYLYLAAEPFPGLLGVRSYPIDVDIDGPRPQSRWAVAFRLLLAVPAIVMTTIFQYVFQIVGFFGWFVCLALGRMPRGMRDLIAYCLRYQAQTFGYVLLLTGRYPSLASEPQTQLPE